MREWWALVVKDLLASVRELEFLLYLLLPVVAALALRWLPGLVDDTPTRHRVVVVAGPAEAAVVAALSGAETLEVVASPAPAKASGPAEAQVRAQVEAAEALVEAGEAVAAVVLPAGFAVALGGPEPPTLRVHHAGRSPTAVMRVNAALRGTLEKLARPLPAAHLTETFAGDGQPRLSIASVLGHAALVLSLLFGSVFVVPLGFCEEREHGLLEALLVTGVPIGTVLAAKIGFGFILTLSASLAVALVTHGAGALPLALLHLGPAVVCLLAVGIAVSLLAHTRKQAELVSAAALMALSVPPMVAEASPAVAALARWTPTGVVADALSLDLSGVAVPLSQRLWGAGVLAVWTAVAFGFAAYRVRRLEQ